MILKNKISAIFIPVGVLPYLKNYQIIAQSFLRTTSQATLQTNFVSAKDISIEQIPQLHMGRVNRYCTTSFWAPQIYLMQFFPQATQLTFQNTHSFQDMLHKTAEKELNCSMVWNMILQQNPQDSNQVKELFHKSHLPAPILITQPDIEFPLRDKITQFVSQDENAFFKGFQQPDMNLIQHFIMEMKAAQNYFKIHTI